MRFVIPLSISLSVSCVKTVPVEPAVTEVAPVAPYALPSTLPYEFPAFDKIAATDFRAGFEAAMAAERREVDAIAANPEPATFENTLVALERAGQHLDRVGSVFFNLVSSNTNDDLQALDAELAPKLAAHQDAIAMDARLFARVDALFAQRDGLGLDPEQRQLLERTYHGFVRSGAKLGEADKETLKKINEQLSSLSTKFDQNLLDATRIGAVIVDDRAQLAGLSDEQIGAAAEAAKERGLEGKWVLPLINTTVQPVLAQLEDRSLRERVYRASSDRASSGEFDNTGIVLESLKLRSQKAALLGYANWAAYALAEETAAEPDAVNRILGDLGPAALARARDEATSIQKVIDAKAKASKGKSFELQPWDWAFYAEQVRKDQFAFDQSEVKPYFELEHVLVDGVLWSATQLYGVTFEERRDLPVYTEGVRVFEVSEQGGDKLGLVVFDFYARENKQGGAWMSTFVNPTRLFGQKPVVINNLNVAAPAPGQPTLLTFDEVNTMFHEFGHGLHGLFQDVTYPSLTDTPPDFAEYPSQFNEMWQIEPVVLAHYAVHYETGAPMPQVLLDKVLAASRFNQGYDTTEYLAAAIIDQAWHQTPADQLPPPAEWAAFEQKALGELSFAPVPPRYHTPYFAHIFNGGYAAGYYAYIWSEVLARDTGAWFHAHGGLTRDNGQRYREMILSKGRTVEPGPLFEAFYGGKPEVGPLLEYRGLASPTPAKN